MTCPKNPSKYSQRINTKSTLVTLSPPPVHLSLSPCSVQWLFLRLTKLSLPWTMSAWGSLATLCLQLTSSEKTPWQHSSYSFSVSHIFSHITQFFPPWHLPLSVITHLMVCWFIYCLPHCVASRKQLGLCLFLITKHRAPSSGAVAARMLHKYLLNEFTLSSSVPQKCVLAGWLLWWEHFHPKENRNNKNLNFRKTQRLWFTNI